LPSFGPSFYNPFMFRPRAPRRLIPAILTAATAALVPSFDFAAQEPGGLPAHATDLKGAEFEGRIVGDTQTGFRFQPLRSGAALPLETLQRIVWPDPPAGSDVPTRPSSIPLFVLRLGGSDQISGRLGSVTADTIRLDSGPSDRPITASRSGVREIAQMPGEVLVLADDFETLDPARWQVDGRNPEIVESSSNHALALPAGRTSLRLTGLESLAAGRLELRYSDPGSEAPGHLAAIELTFHGASGPETLRVDLGWASPRLSVRTTGAGPAMAVQPLAREKGWRRLTVEFAPDRREVSVDQHELAYGAGPGGALTGLRLLTESAPDAPAEPDLRATFDDLVLKRHAEPVESIEHDLSQDEVRLVAGDQVFGRVTEASRTAIRIDLLGKPLEIPWSDVAGLTFRRDPHPSDPLAGLWVQARWQPPGHASKRRSLDQVEGVLSACDSSTLTIQTPYAGEVAIPAAHLRQLVILGRTRRMVIDPTPHHLGNSLIPTLNPPQPDGRTLDVTFRTPAPPPKRIELVVDVVQAIGIEGDPSFSPRVRRGELLTHLSLDGQRFDQLNRHITTPNDEPIRLRVTLPAASLEPGEHTIGFEQVGTRDDPSRLDNLGILVVALEMAELDGGPASPSRTPSPEGSR
jgi:hypothetical protein